MSFSSEDIERPDGLKSALFCPECDRSAPIDEGWALAHRDGRREVACPDCEAVLVSQPEFKSDRRRPVPA